MTAGAGIFFDGRVSARRDVRVTLGPRTLQIDDAAGRLLAEWPYDEIESLSAPDTVLRLGRQAMRRWSGWRSLILSSPPRSTRGRRRSIAAAASSTAKG